MALPNTPGGGNSDQGSDDPKQALLTDLAGLVAWATALTNALGALAELNAGQGLEADGSGSLRVRLQATSYLLREATGLKLDTARATGNALLGTRFRDMPRVQKTAAYTVQASDAGFMIVFNSASAVTCSLPALDTQDVDGMIVGIKNIGAGAVTIDPFSTQTIAGQAGQVIQQSGVALIKADLTAGDWDIVSGGLGSAFASGTRMLFQQTNAPTGWTKQTATSLNESAIRIVTGSASNGGSDAFSTVFAAGKVTGGRTLTIAQMPSHDHTMGIGGGDGSFAGGGEGNVSDPTTTGDTGGGQSHNHDLTMNVKYTDVIVAAKD